jgi:putative ABC transport system permease protein
MFAYYLDLAFRSLKRNKVLTALMVIAIAVGIGASMTTLTVMRLLSGDPIPARSAHLFYAQIDPDPTPGDRKEPYDVIDYQSAVDLWGAHRADRQTLIIESPVRMRAPDVNLPAMMPTMASVTADFFSMFDVPFQFGNGWTAEDDTSRAQVAVISADLNQKLFGGANSVGRTLRLRDTDVRIIGVLKPWRPSPLFYMVAGAHYANGDTADLYSKTEDIFTPFFTGLELNDGNFSQYTCWHLPDHPGHLRNSRCVWVRLWVQLGDSSKVAAYKQFLDGYAAQKNVLGGIGRPKNTRLRSLLKWIDFEGVVPCFLRLQTWLAFAFLAICLFNTIGLLLAKFLRRGGEIGVRRALGATRGAVFAQCLVEAGMVGLIGGVVGWLLALAGLWMVRQQAVPYADLAHLDAPMFLLTFVLAIAASLLAGVLPALRASRLPLGLQLKTL